MKTRRIGLVLAAVLSVAGVAPAVIIGPDPATGRIGTLSMIVAAFAVVAAVVTMVLLVPAWRGGVRASSIIAVLQLAGILTALPAFFAPAELTPPGGVVLAAVGALLAVAIFTMIIFDASVWLLHLVTVIIIVALYAAGVAVMTSLVPASADRFVQTCAAIAVALLFQPVLSFLRRGVDLALYGKRADPAAAARQVGRHAGDPGATIGAALDDAARTLHLPRLDVLDEGLVLASSRPRPRQAPPLRKVIEIPLDISSALRLRVTLRAGEHRLHPDDRAALGLLCLPLTLLIRESQLLAQLQEARAALAEARERAQRDLHRDLHDGIGPLLTGALMRADAANNLLPTDGGDARVHLDAARSDLRTALSELRRVVHGRWPLELEQRGLWGALTTRASRSGAGITLPTERPILSPAVELATYRIIGESLANVDRHAPGRTASVAVRVDRDALDLRVDNDSGPTAPGAGGLGIASIRARAEELGGRAEAGPGTAGGWHVRARLPLAVPRQVVADAAGDGTDVDHRRPGT